MISIGDLPAIVEEVRVTPKYSSRKSYYGLNVNSGIGLEPVDQLDGFLVARYVQELFGSENRFYPLIAGVYSVFNARSQGEAEESAKRRAGMDKAKKALLERIMDNLGLEGSVLTTYDLWRDETYWRIFYNLVKEGIVDTLPDKAKKKGMQMKDFPKKVLGSMCDIMRAEFDSFYSRALYLPAEVAEALWLRERFGVEWKIGPSTEEIYDVIIFNKGVGIVRTTQPKAIENETVVGVLPYKGSTTQPKRILFSDTPETLRQKCWIGNPSYERAIELADIFEMLSGSNSSGPIERIYRMISLGKDNGEQL